MKKIVDETIDFVKNKLIGEGSGHDWWHVYRVYKTATLIAKTEKGNLFVIQLAALLHDIADWKMHDGNIEIGAQIAGDFLTTLNAEITIIEHVCDIIKKVSFKGAKTKREILTKEGQIVQDADRLDAIGAVGIARTFAYGGYKNREIYNPAIKPTLHKTFEQYKKNAGPAINHFYEKLLLLKDLMNTETSKSMATQRHEFMKSYLSQFHQEVE